MQPDTGNREEKKRRGLLGGLKEMTLRARIGLGLLLMRLAHKIRGD